MTALIAPCELLCLKKEDFNNVLKDTIKKQWDEIQEAMSKFSYFDGWDDVAIRECCLLSIIKSYEPNQILLGDGEGQSSSLMVYFIIEGKCTIIEHLWVIEEVKKGIKSYKLYEPPQESTETKSEIKIDEEERRKSEDKRTPRISIDTVAITDDHVNSVESTKSQLENAQESTGNASYEDMQEMVRTFSVSRNMRESNIAIVKRMHERRSTRKCRPFSLKMSLPSNVKLRFMQVCVIGEKGSFRDGEFLKHRRVIALTPVKCLLIPSYWLMQHNKGNVWDRIRKFLMFRIPTRQTVFRTYVENKKWIEYRTKLRNDVLATRKFPNNTTIHDVPYSIRVFNESD